MIIKFIKRFLLTILMIILFLPILLFLAFHVKPVQNYLNSKITVLLQKTFNTKVIVSGVYYDAPFDIVLTDLYVEDYQLDTLLFMQEIKVRPLFYNLKTKTITIDNISIRGLRTEYHVDTSGFSNFDFFLSNLPDSETESQTSSTSINIKIHKINIEKSSAFYTNAQKDTLPYSFDVDSLDFKRFSAKIYNINYSQDSLSFQINRIAAYETSGFKVRHLSANVIMVDEDILVQDYYMALGHTKLLIPHIEIYPSELGYSDIENLFFDVKINNNSTFETADFAYFSPFFKTYSPSIKFGLISDGTMSDFNIKEAYVAYGNNTICHFSGKVTGLPEVDSSYFDLRFKDISVSKTDLLSLKDPETQKIIIDFPESIEIPDYFQFKGSFKGFTSDFFVEGGVNSSIGDAKINFDVVLNDIVKSVAGFFTLNEFNVGYLLQNEKIGKITLKDTLDITMYDSNTFIGFNYADVSFFEFNKYSYNNIYFSSELQKDTVTLNLSINDPNIVINAEVDADLSGDKPKIAFDVNLDTARLYYLNLIDSGSDQEKDIYASLSTHFKGYVSGTSFSNLKGSLIFDEPLYMIKNMLLLQVDDFFVNVDYAIDANNDTIRTISVVSEFVDGFIQGEHNINDLRVFAENLLPVYFPAFKADTTKDIFAIRPNAEKLFIDLKIKDLSKITNFVAPTVNISQNSTIIGELNSINKNFFVNISFDSLSFNENKISNLEVNIFGDTLNLTSTIKSDSILASAIKLKNIVVSSISENNSSSLIISWNNHSKMLNLGEIVANVNVKKDTFNNVVFNSSLPKNIVYINNVKWTIRADSILFDSTGIDVKKFAAVDSSIFKQIIGAHGKISDNPADFLNFYIKGFDLSQLNPLIQDVKIGGKLRTQAKISLLLDSFPKIEVFNNITNIKVNDVIMGDIEQSIRLDSTSIIKSQTLLIDKKTLSKTVNGNRVSFDTSYNVLNLRADFNSQTDSFFLKMNIENLKLKPIQKYVEDYVKFNFLTKLNGILYVEGNALSQDVQGFLNLFGGFKIIPTGARYSLNQGMRIDIQEKLITIENTVITGPNLAGDATFGGTIKHNSFHDPYFDLYFRADTISFMNLPRTNNSSKYYGNFIASGDIGILGYLQDLSITADIITEAKTNLTILLDRPNEVDNKTAIVSFIDPRDTLVIDIDDDDNQSNINIDINLTLKPEAKFKIIFDELTDEAFEIQGEGIIKVKQSSLGDIVVFGNIIIENGEYNFVLENIINKKFIIQKGSSISFNGAPTDGIIDITTIYTIKNTDLYNLLLDDAYKDVKTQADCYIGLTGSILQPEIKFDVDLPKADRKIATQVDNLEPANMNKQFLSLLLISRFQPLPGLTFDPNDIAGANFNAGELVSNQLNSLLSNLGTDVDLDVNYITGDQATTDQFDVELSIPILNDKVSINTDLGVGGNNVNSQSQNNFIGDFDIEVKLNKKGNFLLTGFNKTNRNDYDASGYTQGVGLLFKTDLDNIFFRDSAASKQDTITINN